MVANGQSHDENHVSSTSSSWRTGPPQASHVAGSSIATVMWSHPSASQYHAGIRCPHHSWREMFQSRISVSQCSYTLPHRSGTNVSLPSRYAWSAGSASGRIFTNHWSESRGSTTVWQR